MQETPNISVGNKDAQLYSEDLAPVPFAKRTWGTWNYAALWISMSLCIPTYMLASSLIQGGMNWWESILTILIGNSIVLIPMILNGRAGAKYGIPFPWCKRREYPSNAKGSYRLRLVWYSNMDWGFCTLPNGKIMASVN